MTTLWRTSFAAMALLALSPTVAFAQQGPRDRQTSAIVHQAMEDYQNLEIDSAVNRLHAALRSCNGDACSPAVAAQVHDSLGIVAVQGQNDAAAGTNEFVEALRLDASTMPDQLLVTPEISHAFQEAQRRVGITPGGGSSSASTPAHPTSHATASAGGTHASVGSLLHTPPTEQLENTPLPIFVENQNLSPAHVYLYFRGNGMTQFRQIDMRRVADGYGVEVPCGQVIQGSIDYYIQAVDASGNVSASVATEASPDHVDIVSRRTVSAPSLPGQLPPETCQDECPPGMSGPHCHPAGHGRATAHAARGHAGLGDPCTANECGEGLHCDAGACSVGEAPGGSDSSADEHHDDGTPERYTRFAIDIGGGIGLGFLSGHPQYAEALNVIDRTTGQQVIGANGQPEIVCGLQTPGATQYVCSNSIQSGFAATGFLSAVARYDVSPRIGIGLGLRYQFDTADTSVRSQTLPNLLVFGRLYYAFTGHGFMPSGFTGSVFAGGGVGQIEPKPALPPSQSGPSAHVLSGLGNFDAGGRIEYGLRNGLHFAAELAFNFMAPTFLFDTDLTAYIGLNF